MMEDGEATQEPIEGAPAPTVAETSNEPLATTPPEVEAAAEGEAESSSHDTWSTPADPMDWSHLRGFQTVEPTPESLAARADYADELGKELAARAARFARSVDESIVLSSEGLLRWLGDPVARVVAGDSLLQPRAVLLADEALSGEDRGAVETRVALWLAAHLRCSVRCWRSAMAPISRTPRARSAKRSPRRSAFSTGIGCARKSRRSIRPREARCASSECVSARFIYMCRRC
jgi:hypothetical protein